MIFIPYDLLAYDQFPTIFCDTVFCPATLWEGIGPVGGASIAVYKSAGGAVIAVKIVGTWIT